MEIKFKIVLGKEIQKSQSERGAIEAAIWNANKAFKNVKEAIKSEIYTPEQATDKLLPIYNELLAVEFLVNIYHELWQEKFSKIKLQIELFINPKMKQPKAYYQSLSFNGFKWSGYWNGLHHFIKDAANYKGYETIECKEEMLTNGDMEFMAKNGLSYNPGLCHL